MLYSESQLRRVILLVSRLFSTAVYPACDPLTTALSLFQVSDLFAQSDLSWSLLLGDLSRSAGVWGVAPAVPSLHEAFQSWCRLFSTAYWKSQERFYSSFVVPCENNTILLTPAVPPWLPWLERQVGHVNRSLKLSAVTHNAEEVADHEAILSLTIRFFIRKESLTMGSEIHCVPLLALLLCRALPLLHLDLLPHGFAFKLLHLEASIQSSIKPLRAAACLSRFEPLHSLCLLTSETLQCCTACCP